MDKVKVAVRVRPFSRREIDLGTRCILKMDNAQTVIDHPSQGKQAKVFAFDHCFWSFDESHSHFSSQEQVFDALGLGLLDNAFLGYNACILAYGQTGSGKSFTMMGSRDQKGIIPRLCDELFDRIHKTETPTLSYKVEVSYMEIYNEKVRDLLDPHSVKHNLKVREHNILGPYVDGLSMLAVTSFEQIESLMEEGNKSRTVAATNMNAESSRSHAVFEIKLSQTLLDVESGVSGEKVSRVSLVDLAGSERVQKTGAVGERLKEGSNINKSLTTLGLVISALADQSSTSSLAGAVVGNVSSSSSAMKTSSSKQKFVPYRDSVLTWLLKDNLGGNSRTVMIATVSPAADNYEESLSTLRYADRAKRIVNHAVVNEDPNAKIIRELRAEVESLKKMVQQKNQGEDLSDRLHESEKLMSQLTQTWEEKLKQTELVHHERVQQLEQMGISVQASGIRVDQAKFYLVNLNPDPSLNELLVYYLKDRTFIGRCDAQNVQDIQLSGLGIQMQHAAMLVEENELYLLPIDGAKSCVNGSVVTGKVQLRHGDRIVWGHNHFFRVNCPGQVSQQNDKVLDYDFAKEELLAAEFGDSPLNKAVAVLERQHEDDKQAALAKQKKMYETQLQLLRQQIPMTPMTPTWSSEMCSPVSVGGFPGGGTTTPLGSSVFPRSDVQKKYVQWASERDESFKRSLAKLKEDIVKANGLVREANIMSSEMGKFTSFHVTLQIPAENLTPSKTRTGAFVSEPAIMVKRKGQGSQIWSMEKLENKLIDMRDLYEDWKEQAEPDLKNDPFYESEERHNLIGVANVFLEVLFHDVKLDYLVPIISQQGEVAGRLHVEICRIPNGLQSVSSTSSGDFSLPSESSDNFMPPSNNSNASSAFNDSGLFDQPPQANLPFEPSSLVGTTMTCRICIKEATNLPANLSNYLFCQYSFWNCPGPLVIPVRDRNDFEHSFSDGSIASHAKSLSHSSSSSIAKEYRFDHEAEFTVIVTDEFLEHVQDSALSIEVWGHKVAGSSHSEKPNIWDVPKLNAAKSLSLKDRWAEVTRRLELWVEIHELNDVGEYAPTELVKNSDVPCGGVFQLRQGQQRRIVTKITQVPNSGLLPLVCQRISSVLVGCITTRTRNLQKGLDSYQEEDLNALRSRWNKALNHRSQYLDDHIKQLLHKPNKSEQEAEREQSLIAEWVALTEERNAVMLPTTNSCVPGAPADWLAPPAMEKHIPVLFLDLSAEDMSNLDLLPADHRLQIPGMNSLLPKEYGGKMFPLQIKKFDENEMCAEAFWDSSVHENSALNRVTSDTERIYAILQVFLRLSHPAECEIVLRKRLCFNIIKRVSLTQKLMKRLKGSDQQNACGVTYEVVATIPKATQDPEARETLALVAATATGSGGFESSLSANGESYIEKYLKGVSEVESILALDRVRQEVAIKELLTKQKKLQPKKSTSLPTFGVSYLRSGNDSLLNAEATIRRQRPRVLPEEYANSMENKSLLARPTFLCLNSHTAGITNITSLISPVGPASSLSLPLRGLMNPVAEETSTPKHAPASTNVGELDSSCALEVANGCENETFLSISKPPTDARAALLLDLCSSYATTEYKPLPDSESISTVLTLDPTDQGEINSVMQLQSSDSQSCWPSANGTTEASVEANNDAETVIASFAEDFLDDLMSSCKEAIDVPAYTTIENSSLINSFASDCTLSALVDAFDVLATSNCSNSDAPCEGKDQAAGYESSHMNDLADISFNPVAAETTFDSKSSDVTGTVVANCEKEFPNESAEPETHFDTAALDISTYSDYGVNMTACYRNGNDSVNGANGNYDDGNDTASLVSDNLSSIDIDLSSLAALSTSNANMDCESLADSMDGSSVASLASFSKEAIPSWLELGTKVSLSSAQSNNNVKSGIVRFIGQTEFAPGYWVGVELFLPQGKHNGTMDGVAYFSCRNGYGVFVRPDRLTPFSSAPKRRSSATVIVAKLSKGQRGPDFNKSEHESSPEQKAVLTGSVQRNGLNKNNEGPK